MWFTVFLLSGCFFWIAVEGQEAPRPKSCGQRWKPQKPVDKYPRIKSEALPNSWPWHVGIYCENFGPYPYCGGTLIASNWVLTSAHCIVQALLCNDVEYGEFFRLDEVAAYDIAVTVANHDLAVNERPAYNVRVDGAIIHPSYGARGNGFDIALVQLNRKVKRSSRTEYACLPEPGFTVPFGEFCYTAGWGLIPNPPHAPHPDQPKKLMELRTPIVSTEECKREHRKMNKLQDVCTDTAYGHTCHGDSGGGLYCFNENKKKWVIYGVVYFGDPHCIVGFNGFTLTAPKLEWINKVMNEPH